MHRRSHNSIFVGVMALATVVVAGAGFVVVSGGGPMKGAVELPGADVAGLADRGGDDLGLGEADADNPDGQASDRPVLQVTSGEQVPGSDGAPLAEGQATPRSDFVFDPIDEGSQAPAPAQQPTPARPEAEASPPAKPAESSTPAVDAAPPAPSEAVDGQPPSADPVPEKSPPAALTAPGATGSPDDSGERLSATPAPTPQPTGGEVPADDLSAAERELVRLTNELRADPNGPLARQGPVTDCGGRLALDAATGGYQPAAPLVVESAVSLSVSRPWSGQLTTDLQHRPDAGIAALQQAGVAVWSAGENIAYHNYDDTALRHFVGWRESDGHFCNMMDPAFTHLAVGEQTRPDGYSFAVQNFFSLLPSSG